MQADIVQACAEAEAATSGTMGGLLTNAYPMHLLLPDPLKANKASFIVSDCSLYLASDIHLDVYDNNGNLLGVKSVSVNAGQPLTLVWSDFGSGAASMTLTMDSSDKQVLVSIPQDSNIVSATKPVQKFTRSAKDGGSGIVLYNPSENPVDVIVQGDVTETVTLYSHVSRVLP